MRIENLELSPGHPESAQAGPHPALQPGAESSTTLTENQGFTEPGGLDSGPMGPYFEGFPGRGRKRNPRIRECQYTAKIRDRLKAELTDGRI